LPVPIPGKRDIVNINRVQNMARILSGQLYWQVAELNVKVEEEGPHNPHNNAFYAEGDGAAVGAGGGQGRRAAHGAPLAGE